MDMENRVRAHWDLVRFVVEEHLQKYDDSLFTLSVSDGSRFEYMIFLGKPSKDSDYEVCVYKSTPEDTYIPHENDNILRYISGKEFDSFFFDTFIKARNFVEFLRNNHPEYEKRPMKEYKHTSA